MNKDKVFLEGYVIGRAAGYIRLSRIAGSA